MHVDQIVELTGSQVANKHANLKKGYAHEHVLAFCKTFSKAISWLCSFFLPPPRSYLFLRQEKRIKMDKNERAPPFVRTRILCQYSAAFVKTGPSVFIQNVRVTRAHSQISRRNSTLSRTVCDLDRDNRDERIRASTITNILFLETSCCWIYIHVILLFFFLQQKKNRRFIMTYTLHLNCCNR